MQRRDTDREHAMEQPLRILLIEDSEDDADLVLRALRESGYQPQHRRVYSATMLHEALGSDRWDVILGDYTMPGFTGEQALSIVRDYGFDIPFIFVSGTIGEDKAVAAMKAGAHDYVVKGNLRRLPAAIARELREAEVRRERARAESERRDLEAQFHQAQKMESIGQLAGGIAHDFNNLLTAILGSLQFLKMEVADRPEAEEWAKRAIAATLRGAQLTNQLLSFSRKQVLTPQIVDLNRTLGDMIDFMQRTIGSSINIRTDFSPDLRAVRLDPGLLQSALLNLVINARDAMHHGGELAIETRNTDLDEVTARGCSGLLPGRYVVLTVSDTGSGIPQDLLERIFEPFFTTKENGKGTGLGLSMVHGFVRQSGGHIDASSAPGAGTRFRIVLPEAESAAEETSAPIRGTRHARRVAETILYVEDDDDVRATTSAMLKECGYRVIEAQDGPAALVILDSDEPIDLLFTDVIMAGGMNGLAVADAARKRRAAIKILLTSGYADDALARREPDEPTFELIRKPYHYSALIQRLREVLDPS
jgi:signal transduction histidine kinase